MARDCHQAQILRYFWLQNPQRSAATPPVFQRKNALTLNLMTVSKRPLSILTLALVMGLLFSVVFSVSPVAAENLPSFQQVAQLERLHDLPQAMNGYLEILSDYQATVSGNPQAFTPHDSAVAIAAAFRLGQVVPVYLNGGSDSLVDQLDILGRSYHAVSEMIAILAQHQADYSPKEYRLLMALLVSARGQLVLGWAERLYVSIAWKNYLLVPMPDLISMVSRGAADIETSLKMESMDYFDPLLLESDRRAPRVNKRFFGWRKPLYQAYYHKRISELGAQSAYVHTVQLAMLAPSTLVSADRLADYQLERCLAPVMLLRSPKAQRVMKKAATINTVNQAVDYQPLNRLFLDLSKQLGSR